MKRTILLALALSVIISLVAAAAYEEESSGIPILLTKIVNKLDELKTAIENLKLNPTVNIENEVPTPNITIMPEKECNWEKRVEIIEKDISMRRRGYWTEGEEYCSNLEVMKFPTTDIGWEEVKVSRILTTYSGTLQGTANVKIYRGSDPANLQIVHIFPVLQGTFSIPYQEINSKFLQGGLNFYRVCITPEESWSGYPEGEGVILRNLIIEYQVKPANC